MITIGLILHGNHTKGTASRYIKQREGLDACIYLGNDINDLPMFSEALKDGDFIVIANNEDEKITKMLVDCMQIECNKRGINWEEAKILVLEEKNVNRFLLKMHRILRVMDTEKKMKAKKINYNKSQEQTNKENMLKLKSTSMKRTKQKRDKSR